MRLECPACAAAYDVPETVLAKKKALKCARCATVWVPHFAAPPAETIAPFPPSEPAPQEPRVPEPPEAEASAAPVFEAPVARSEPAPVAEPPAMDEPEASTAQADVLEPEEEAQPAAATEPDIPDQEPAEAEAAHPGHEPLDEAPPSEEEAQHLAEAVEALRMQQQRVGAVPVWAAAPVEAPLPRFAVRPLPPAPPIVPHQPPTRMVILGAWAASLVAIAGFGWGAIAFRAPIMHAWPASGRFFAMLGL